MTTQSFILSARRGARTLVPSSKFRKAIGFSPTSRAISSEGSTAKGPVSWTNLGLVAVASAAAVGYFKVQRERRLEEAIGKIVTSESDSDNEGLWTPDKENYAPRKFVKRDGVWVPEINDQWGGSGKPAIGGPWTLVDVDTKELVSESSFKGKFTLLYFGFARCPDICPSEMVKVGKIMDSLPPDVAEQLIPIFVTIDPARDSIKSLRAYAQDFHPSYRFLTGTPQQVQQMAKSYRVYVSKADETEDGDYLVDHSIVLYLHDENGTMVDVCTQSMKPSDVVQRIISAMKESSEEQLKKLSQ